jgi:hypothetical protein
MLVRIACLATCFSWLTATCAALSLAAQDSPTRDTPTPAPPPGDKQQTTKAAYFRERLGALRLTRASDPQQTLTLVGDPVITFENPVSQMWDGMMFVWTDRGRPAAAVKSYYHSLNKRWGRTFVALSTERIEMSQQGQPLWSPAQAGLAFAPLPDAPQPAADARRRLSQMRDIARRFSMVDHWGLKDPTDWQLRLLTTPLFRYEAPVHHVVDGAIFGYVANSPEALVLLEARQSAEGLAWHYAASRFTRFEVTVSLDGKQVAHFPRLEAWPASGVYFHDPALVPAYPFQRTAESDAAR